MSERKLLRFKIANRRYSQFKKSFVSDTPQNSTDNQSTPTTVTQSEVFYRQMFERNRAVKLVVDPLTAQIVEANQAASDFYGYTIEHLKSLRVPDISAASQAEILEDIKRTVAHKGSTFQARHRLASGEIRDVEIFTGLLEVNHQNYLYAIVQDITDRKKTEKALRESENRYRLLAQNISNSAVFMFDRDMRYIVAEGPFLKRFGSAYGNIVGKTLQEVLPEAALKFLISIYQRALDGESFSYERENEEYAYRAYVTPVRDDEGKITGGMILSQDITEAKRAERALRESQALYRLFTRYMPNTNVVMYDCDLHITLAEGPYLKRFGTVWDNAVGKTPHDLYGAEVLKILLPVYKRALEGEAFTFERTTKDFAYQSYVTPLWDDDGKIIGGMILSHDITDYKRAEEALRASEARFHSLVDLAPVGIIQTDLNGDRTFCNNHWCEITGITLEQALGDVYYETIYPEDLPIVSAAWTNMMETNLPFDNVTFRYQRPDKTTVWVSGNGRPLFDANGAVTGYIGTVTDISSHKLLEDTLVVSESRFRTLIDFAPVGIVETDQTGNIILTNTQWSALSGLSEGFAFRDSATSTIHPDDFERIQAISQASLENASSIENIEYRFVHPDGKIVWVSESSRPLFNELGEVSGHIITMTDITERKRLEEALRDNEERLKIVTNNIHDLVTQMDVEGRLLFASPSARIILGIEPEDMIGKLTYEFVHPDDRGIMIAAQQAAVEKGDVHVSGEGRLRHADGHYINIETEGTIIFDAHSHYAGSVLITRDITERKRLIEALRQNEERLRNITDNLRDMVSQSDANGLFTFISPSYQTLLGYEAKSLIGTSAIEIIHPEDVGRVVQAFQDAFNSQSYHFNVECRVRHMDGHYVDVDIVGKLFFDSESVFMGGVFINRDISERKRLQNLLLEKEKLQSALDKEYELSALKTRMMERIAHEFRTPLTVIQAASETLTHYLDRLTLEQRSARSLAIQNQIQRLTDMLQEIGQVVNGNFTPEHIHRQSTDVSKLFREVADDLERQFNLVGKYVLDLPQTAISSLDPQVFKNAIMHIMRNAARFSDPASAVTVKVLCDEKGMTIQVIDSGIGIPPKELPRIFEPFFRGSNINEISGLGVGLTIARAAIEAHNGSITVESAVKQGSTFTIWLPN